MAAMPEKSTQAELAMLALAPEMGTRPFYFRKGSSDEGVIEQIFTHKHYDLRWVAPSRHAELIMYVERRVGDGAKPLIVDAGANIGAAAVFFALALPDARVVAVEPDAANIDILRRNVDGLEVELLEAALASAAGRSRVIDPGQGFWGFRTIDAGGEATGSSVSNVTIPEIYARHRPGFFPAIVKVDIEGAEKDVFRDSLEWVRQTPVIIVELHDWLFPRQRPSATFLEVISGLDRDFITVGDNIFSIANDLI
jgi:FkbM family methyltransferase